MHHNQIKVGPEKDQPVSVGDQVRVAFSFPHGGQTGTILSWSGLKSIRVAFDSEGVYHEEMFHPIALLPAEAT